MDLSVVVCGKDFHRELPLTVYSLSRSFQRGIEDLHYEIVVLDHGSQPPFDPAVLGTLADNVRIERVDPAPVSPAPALNATIRKTSGEFLCVIVDGARMVTPGLLSKAMDAFRQDKNALVGSLSFNLGPYPQSVSQRYGYNQAIEDVLLDQSGWEEDGYRLFDILCLDFTSEVGWFGSISETNSIFVSRAFWDALGGFDERFVSPGAGCANWDFWKRALDAVSHNPWIVMGEGTVHQFHGGVSTGGNGDSLKVMYDEYERIKGVPLSVSAYEPRLCGELDPYLEWRFSRQQTLLRDVLSLSPDRLAAQSGRLAEQEAGLANALKLATSAVQLAPESASYHHRLGVIQEKAGTLEQAEASLKQAVSLDTAFWKSYLALSRVYERQERLDESIAAMRAGVEFGPVDVNQHLRLARLLQRNDELDAAVSAYCETLRLDPGLIEAQNPLISLLSKLGRDEEAAIVAKEAAVTRPDDIGAWRRAGNLLRRVDRIEEAVEAFRRVVSIEAPTGDDHLTLSKLLVTIDCLDEAVDHAGQAADGGASDAQLHKKLGYMLARADRLEEAEASHRKAIEAQPDLATAHFALSLVLGRQSRVEEASAAVEHAIMLDPDDERFRRHQTRLAARS